jgi:predicted anti-sigma-YlaC factor YlaD
VNCEARQEQLEQIAFEGEFEALVVEQREHLETCAACRSHFALLRQLIGEARDAQPTPLSEQLRASVHERATRTLRATGTVRETRSNLIFQWEIAAPLAVALLALPIAIGQGWLWTHGLSALLEPWLPTSVLTGLTIFYAASAALTLGGLYGSLPFAIAYANRNRLEAP